jgi:DNA-binding protein HU-beta
MGFSLVWINNPAYPVGIIHSFFHFPMGKMTKSQLMRELAEKTGHTKKDVEMMIEAMTEMAYKMVKSSGEFTIPGIGKLVKVHSKARMGRNPATGEQIQIPARIKVKFRVAKAAKDAVL